MHRSSATESPKTPRLCIAGSLGATRLVHQRLEIVFDEWPMLPLPLPEELFDVGDVRAAGDVLDALVEDRKHGRADEGFAGVVGDFDFHRGVLAGLVGVGGREDVDVEDALGGRNVDFADVGVDAAIGDGDCFDEEVRHVLVR